MPDKKIGFIVMYRQPDNKKKFDERYQNHLKVFFENVGNFVESAHVVKVDDNIFYQMAVVMLKPSTDFDTLMSSPEMKVVVDDIFDFVPEDKCQVVPVTQTVYGS